jgi:hypothetical protein
MQVDKVLQFILITIRAVDLNHAFHEIPEGKPSLVAKPQKGALPATSATKVSVRLHAKWSVLPTDDHHGDTGTSAVY